MERREAGQQGFLSLFWIKVIGGVLAAAATAWAVHTYNESLREDGRAEIRLEQREAFDAERQRLEGAAIGLAKSYYTEKAKREAAEKRLDKEREDAIRASGTAANMCFDSWMRDNWNRDSGHDGTAGRGVAPAMSDDPVAP